jgi:hypothetical protein
MSKYTEGPNFLVDLAEHFCNWLTTVTACKALFLPNCFLSTLNLLTAVLRIRIQDQVLICPLP